MPLTTRIATVSIIIEKEGVREEVNKLLQKYSQYVIGRLGIPYRKRELSVIVVVVDAPVDSISALTGQLGLLPGVSAKTLYSKKEFPLIEDERY